MLHVCLKYMYAYYDIHVPLRHHMNTTCGLLMHLVTVTCTELLLVCGYGCVHGPHNQGDTSFWGVKLYLMDWYCTGTAMSYSYQPCHTAISHVIQLSAMSYSYQPCHTAISHVIQLSAMSYSYQPCHTAISHVIQLSAMSYSYQPCHTAISHVIQLSAMSYSYQPCHTAISHVIQLSAMSYSYQLCHMALL